MPLFCDSYAALSSDGFVILESKTPTGQHIPKSVRVKRTSGIDINAQRDTPSPRLLPPTRIVLVLGGARGVAKDKFRVNDNFAPSLKLLTIVPEDAIENDVADLLSRNVHCSEWWRAEFGQLDVVKAGYGNIARNLKSLIVQFAYHAYSHKIVDAENRGGA